MSDSERTISDSPAPMDACTEHFMGCDAFFTSMDPKARVLAMCKRCIPKNGKNGARLTLGSLSTVIDKIERVATEVADAETVALIGKVKNVDLIDATEKTEFVKSLSAMVVRYRHSIVDEYKALRAVCETQEIRTLANKRKRDHMAALASRNTHLMAAGRPCDLEHLTEHMRRVTETITQLSASLTELTNEITKMESDIVVKTAKAKTISNELVKAQIERQLLMSKLIGGSPQATLI